MILLLSLAFVGVNCLLMPWVDVNIIVAIDIIIYVAFNMVLNAKAKEMPNIIKRDE